MRQAAGIVLVVGIFRELRRAEDIAKFDVLIVVAGCDDDMSVGYGKLLIRHDVGMGVPNTARDFGRDEKIQRLISKGADRRVNQRGVDVTTSAGFLSLHKRRENADYRITTR